MYFTLYFHYLIIFNKINKVDVIFQVIKKRGDYDTFKFKDIADHGM